MEVWKVVIVMVESERVTDMWRERATEEQMR